MGQMGLYNLRFVFHMRLNSLHHILFHWLYETVFITLRILVNQVIRFCLPTGKITSVIVTVNTGDSSVVKQGLVIKRSRFQAPAEAAGEYSSPVSTFCALILASVPPRATAVARERTRSFCRKCRQQVTAKHTCTLYVCGFE